MGTFNIELPETVSRSIIEDIDYSLNVLFPKLFYVIDIKEELIEITIPNVSKIKVPLTLFKVVGKASTRRVENYVINFPLIGKVYSLKYNKERNEVETIYKVDKKEYSIKWWEQPNK